MQGLTRKLTLTLFQVMFEKTSILYHRYMANFLVIYIRLIHCSMIQLHKMDMPLNHIYQMCELLTDRLLVFQFINGYKKLCLSKGKCYC